MLDKRVSCKNTKERTGIKRRTEQVGRVGKGDGDMEGGIQYGEIHWHQPGRQAVLAEMLRSTHGVQQPHW